jgi:hypothetical protein
MPQLSIDGMKALADAMTIAIGGQVSIDTHPKGVSITIDLGPRLQGVGGFGGGEQSGYLPFGSMLPVMVTGTCAFSASQFYHALEGYGWFN